MYMQFICMYMYAYMYILCMCIYIICVCMNTYINMVFHFSLYIICMYIDIHIFAFLLVLKFLHNVPLLAVLDVT